MKSRCGITRLLALSFALGFLCLGIDSVQAKDRCAEFLEGLRKQAFYDIALDYLETVRSDPETDKDFLETIDYETGLTLVAGSRPLPLRDRDRQLEEAQTRFQTFMTEHPEHLLIPKAQAHTADVLVERGRIKLEQAGQSRRTPEEKTQLRAAARTFFQEAQEFLSKVNEQLSAKNRELKNVDPNDVQRTIERDQIRTDVMQVRLALAKMYYEIAHTYEPGSNEYKENLQTAAKAFGEYYKTFSRWVGGWYARIDEARCYRDLGKYDTAYEVLKEIMSQRDEDDSLRRMRTAATAVAMEIAVRPELKKYKEALDVYRAWEQNTALRNESSDEGLAVKYFAAEAAIELVRGLNAADSRQAAQRKECLQLAKDLLAFVAKFPGECRQKARTKMTDPAVGGGEIKIDRPKDSDEARDRAKLAWDRLQDPDVKEEEVRQLRAEALENFRFALAHAPRDMKLDELITIRYCLAYLYWATDEYYDAAVMGEFLARCYPDRPEAQQGAKIAVAAYAKLFGDLASDEDRTFEDGRMRSIAQYVTERWPNSAVADESWMMLIRAAISQRDFDKMIEYLGRISPDSARRGDTELMMGQSLWGEYLEASRLPDDKRPSKQEMAKLLAQSQKTLEDGIARSRQRMAADEEVSYSLAAGALSLAQICLDNGQSEKALALLDDPKIGPHTLTMAGAPMTNHGNFRAETLKATLRTYVAVQQLDRAEETMTALEKASGGANLTRIYLNLGKQLEESLKRIRNTGSPEEATAVARGFTAFLTRLTSRPRKETNFNTLSWVAEMFMSLGGSLDKGASELPAEALEHYKRAADTYRAIIEACRADANYGPQPTSIYSVQIRLAKCLRQMGKYDESLDVLTEVLKAQNTMIDAQREAAYTYQTWAEKKPELYPTAIIGAKEDNPKGGPNGKLIWGWGGIARRVQGRENLDSIFHEARYNLAFCRLQYALSKKGQQQKELLEQALNDIKIVYKLYPELGGKERRGQYDDLLKKIQKLLSLPQEGLKAFDKKATMNSNRAMLSEALACAE